MTAAFIARHPIFDPQSQVVGYELLFRGRGYAADGAGARDNPELATATVVLNSLTELELNRIVGNKPVWINVSHDFIAEGLAEIIPPTLGGLEIAEDQLGDAGLLAALDDLKAAGYHLALDDFRDRPGSEAALHLFDVVKVSIPAIGRDGLTEQVERLRPRCRALLADKVGTPAEHKMCADAGFDLFQGYFFCQPTVVGTRGISANRLAVAQVVAALHRPDAQLADIEPLVARDVALSFRMLRYVNSAYFGLRHEVRSIGQALALLGLDNVRRWATLSALASIGDKPPELTVTALIRARFCELAADQLHIGSPGELFTLGLFSVIDAMMDAPMSDVVESLPLADDVREALVRRRGPKGELLNCVTALERGDYTAFGFITGAGELYTRSLIWATTASESLFGDPGGAPLATDPARPSTARVVSDVQLPPAPAGRRGLAGLVVTVWRTVRRWCGRPALR